MEQLMGTMVIAKIRWLSQTRSIAPLLSEPGTELDVSESARMSGTGEQTVQRELEVLDHYELVSWSGDSETETCTLHHENPTVEHRKGAEQSLLQTWYENHAPSQ